MSWEIRQGDALERLREIPGGSVDMVFTDPPYGHNNNNGDLASRWEASLGLRPYDPERDNRPIINDGPGDNELFRAALPELRRVLVPGCCCCCCCCGGGPDPQFARWSLWMDEVLDFKQMVVWDKGAMGMGWHYRRSYEVVLVAQKPGAACRWYDETHRVENIIRNTRKILPLAHQHPTEKPVALAEFFIQLHTQAGETVLDCFAGHGSTLEAAHRLGRHGLGIELSEEYIGVIQRRLSRITTQQTSLFTQP